MKKINLKYLICLICSSVLLYACLSVFCFNRNFMWDFGCFSGFTPAIFAVIFLGIFKRITEKDFILINEEHSVENEEISKTSNTKKYKYFWIIFLVYMLIFGIISFTQLKVKETMELENMADFSFINICYEEWLVSRICSVFMFVFVYVIYRLFFIKNKSIKSKFLKISYKLFEIFFITGVLFVTLYYFIDIPEFKLDYEYISYKNLSAHQIMYAYLNDGICVKGYSDIRDEFNTTRVIPDKIWGKKVKDLELNVSFDSEKTMEIILPSTFPKKSISNFNYLVNIRLHGKPIEWYEENGIIYNKDGNEIVFINREVENLYISEKIEKINLDFVQTHPLMKTIQVSPDNKSYFLYHNVLYSSNNPDYKSNIAIPDEVKSSYAVAIIPMCYNSKEVRIPPNFDYDFLLIDDTFTKIEKIIIPEECNREIGFATLFWGINEYEVHPKNTYYETFNGCLYTKGLKKLLEISDFSVENELKLSFSLEEINEICLNKLVYYSMNKNLKIGIEENNSNFIVEDNYIYNADKTKLIMPANKTELLPSTEEPLEISESLAKYFCSMDDEKYDSYYIYKGSIYTENLEKLLCYFNYENEKIIKIPAEVKSFSETCITEFIDMLEKGEIIEIVISENNPNFIIENKMLYNKEKTRWIMPLVKMDFSDKNLDDLFVDEEYLEVSKALVEKLYGYEFYDSYKGSLCVYNGNVYTEELKTLLILNENAKILELPLNLEEFGLYSLDEIIGRVWFGNEYYTEEFEIIIDTNHPNFVVEDNLVYNKDKSKLIMPLVKMDKIIINKNVKEISEEFMSFIKRWSIECEIVDDNPYFIIDEDDYLQYNLENDFMWIDTTGKVKVYDIEF